MVNEEAKQVSAAESERLAGIISELSVGEVKCDKCGKAIRHLGRYCLNTRECYHCKTIFNTIAELNGHFIEKHSPDPTGVPGIASNAAVKLVSCEPSTTRKQEKSSRQCLF